MILSPAGSRPMRSHSSRIPSELSQELRRGDVGEDAVGESGCPTNRSLGAASDEDRYRAGRGRAHRQLGKVIHLARVVEYPPTPGLGEDGEDLLHGGAPAREIRAEPGELGLAPAQAQPQYESSLADQVDRGRVFGQAQRVVERRQDDPGPDLDAAGGSSDGGADNGQRGHIPVVDKVVLRGPYRRQAETFCLDGQIDGLLVGPRPVLLARSQLGAQQSETKAHRDARDMRSAYEQRDLRD